jgi:cytochrome d ubiquinol oxidase subunit II
LIPLLLGVVGGNLLYGLPVDVKRDITPSFWSTLNPFALLAGITTVALVAMHGAVYAALKSPTALQNDLRKPAIGAWVLAVALAVALEIYVALATQSPWRANHHSWLALAGLVLAASSAAVPVYVLANKWVKAFIATSLFLASVLALFGLQMYPVLVKSTNGADLDLTIYNSASSDNTMITMLVISAILLPVVIAYKAYIYYTLSTSGTDHADY